MERITGFSRDQLSLRLRLLEGHLSHDMQRGKGVRTLIGDRTLAALRRMAELEKDGFEPQVAATRVFQEIGKPQGNEADDLPAGILRLVKSQERMIEELRRDKTYLQTQLDRAQARIEELERRALPPPRRRWSPWFWRARRSSPSKNGLSSLDI